MATHSLTRRSSLTLGVSALAGSTLGLKGNPRENKAPEPVKIAILGLGNYAEEWIAPAIEQSDYAELTGIITGSPDKIPKWQEKYGIKDRNVYSYQTMGELANNDEIEVVYVITPTGTHADFTIRALEAGKHVICEKPMASTVEECDQMIEAAKDRNLMLQIGYRLYWDPFHVALITAMREREFGDWETMETGFGFRMTDFSAPRRAWRITKDLSVGGALCDVGVYAVQGAFYGGQVHPVRVTAKSWTDRKEIFTEVPEHWEWELEYADGRKSQHSSSYGKGGNYLRLQTPKGKLEIDPAYGYKGQKGSLPTGPMVFDDVYQQRLQIDDQALAIRNRRANITPGEMGRRDMRVIRHVMKAAETGETVEFDGFEY